MKQFLAIAAALCLCACSTKSVVVAPPVPAVVVPVAPIGTYFWGGSVAGYPGAAVMPEGLSLAKSTGTSVIRIYMGPSADQDYAGGACISGFTLVGLAQRPDFAAILTDPQFSTVIITAYDGVTWPCTGGMMGDSAFWSAENTAAVEAEYQALAAWLATAAPTKKFILGNWEGDNQAYCGSMSGYIAGPRCQNGGDTVLTWLGNWFSARNAGIHASGAPNVFSAIEFNSVNLLHNAGLKSILRDVVPAVPSDYVSYSSYESLGSPAQLAADVATIKSLTSRPLFIGELGFSNDPGRLQAIMPTARTAGVSWVIVWALLENPAGFGMFDTNGVKTASGQVVFGQ